MTELLFRPITLALLAPLALGGCMAQQAEVKTGVVPAAITTSTELVYQCSGNLYAVDQMDDAVMLHFPDHARRLNRVRSTSGAKYSDGTVTFWSKGNDATLSYSGQDQKCGLMQDIGPWQRADLRGVSFRGMGQEPGWYVEIAPDRNILFVGDYGTVTAIAPVPPPITEPGRGLTEYYTMSGDTELSIRIQAKACTDSMNGEQFEATVHVRYGQKEYDGCGRAL